MYVLLCQGATKNGKPVQSFLLLNLHQLLYLEGKHQLIVENLQKKVFTKKNHSHPRNLFMMPIS